MDIEARNRIEQFLIKTDYRIIDFVIKGDSRSKIYEIFVDSRKELLVDDFRNRGFDFIPQCTGFSLFGIFGFIDG